MWALSPFGRRLVTRADDGVMGFRIIDRLAKRFNPCQRSFHSLASSEHRADQRCRAEAMKFYVQFISSGDLCFDTGANVGDSDRRLPWTGAKVVGAEPQLSCVNPPPEKYRGKSRVIVA